jgi:hypothetical protein
MGLASSGAVVASATVFVLRKTLRKHLDGTNCQQIKDMLVAKMLAEFACTTAGVL